MSPSKERVAVERDKGFTLRHCPATSNLPTSMSKSSWESLCRDTRKRELEPPRIGHEKKIKSFCTVCMGKIPPEKLTIIDLKKEGKMAKGSPRGTCDCCDEKNLLLRSVGDKNMCGKCSTIYSNARNWLPVVEMALADIYPSKYGTEGFGAPQAPADVVAVAVESVAMERISAAVGYEGTDGDGLIAAVEALAADYRALLLADSWKPSADTIRALGLPEGTVSRWLVDLATQQIAAQLEDRERESAVARIDGEQILRMRDLLGLPMVSLKGLVDQVEWLVDRVNAEDDHAQEVLSTAAEINGLKDQVVAVRTALGGTDSNFDIVRAIAEMAQTLDRYKTHCERLTAERLVDPFPVYSELRSTGKSIESYILDLSLMALRGEVVGLDPAFISTMREAV